MPGIYDNELQEYIESEELEMGTWFVDAEGLLYHVLPTGDI